MSRLKSTGLALSAAKVTVVRAAPKPKQPTISADTQNADQARSCTIRLLRGLSAAILPAGRLWKSLLGLIFGYFLVIFPGGSQPSLFDSQLKSSEELKSPVWVTEGGIDEAAPSNPS